MVLLLLKLMIIKQLLALLLHCTLHRTCLFVCLFHLCEMTYGGQNMWHSCKNGSGKCSSATFYITNVKIGMIKQK